MPFPKNVGLLFFNEDPTRFFPATQIDIVHFPQGTDADQFSEKTFIGPLGRITRDALTYIQNHYLRETVIKHPNRAEAERFGITPTRQSKKQSSMPSITALTKSASR